MENEMDGIEDNREDETLVCCSCSHELLDVSYETAPFNQPMVKKDFYDLCNVMGLRIHHSLVHFKEVLMNCSMGGHPGNISWHDWLIILDEMIFAFSEEAVDNLDGSKEIEERANRGRALFAEYFQHLWI